MSATVHSASSTWMSGTPATCTENSVIRVVRGPTPRPGASAPNSTPTGPASSATSSLPAGMSEAYSPREALAAAGRAQAEVALDAVTVERPDGHPGFHHRDRQRVVEQRARAEAAGLQALERERLDRCAVDIGVEADVAEEHAVGPRHRALAQHHGLRAAEAVRQLPQALAQVGRAAAGAGGERERVQAQLGELRGHLRVDPAGGDLAHRSASSRAASACSPSSENDVPATLPLRPANVIVGQMATA